MVHLIISKIKRIPPLQALKKKYLSFLRKRYLHKLRTNIDNEASIISNNCFGGRITQDLKYKYNSPTAGLFICYPDYINFLRYLHLAIITPIKFKKRGYSKYPEIDRYLKSLKWEVPVGYLELEDTEIEIIFLHYHSEKEAKEKWERRCRRVNLDKLIIFGTDNDLCSRQNVIDFLSLNYKHKFFFSAHDFGLPNTDEYALIKEMKKNKKINGYNKAHILYKYLTLFKYK